jgi:Tfp pilus assembly protein PilF
MRRPWIATLCLVSLVARADLAEPPVVMKELRRVQAAVLKGDADSIRFEYTDRARDRPGDPMPRVYLAWLVLPSDEAWNQLKAIAAIFPDNPWVHYGMGRIYVKWKMKDQARNEADWLLKRDARFYPAFIVQAELAALQDDFASAEALYRKALAIEEDPEARAGVGLMLLRQGKKDEALDHLKRSSQAYPEQPVVLAALVPLLLEAKDPAAAQAAQRAVDLKPKDPLARRLLADLRFDAGELPTAAQEYEALVKLGNADPAALRRLAGLHREAGDAAAEDRVLTLLAASEPKSAEAPLRRAELAVTAKDLGAAEVQLREALKREPARPEVLSRLARLHLDQGLTVDALELYRKLLSLQPEDAALKAQVDALEAGFKLPKKPLRAGVQNVYWILSASLDKLYAERRVARPGLAGKVRVKLKIGADGTVSALEILEDTLQDQPLLGHIAFTLRDATYQEKKVEPIIEFELGKKK